MKPIIQQLLTAAETGTHDQKRSSLIGIYDYLEHPYPHEEGYAELVQQLIILLSKEKGHELRKLLIRNIEGAYMYKISLDKISFEPLTKDLNTSDPFFIRSVLYLLSMTYKKEYIPLIEKYLTHPDKTVSEEAQLILDTW